VNQIPTTIKGMSALSPRVQAFITGKGGDEFFKTCSLFFRNIYANGQPYDEKVLVASALCLTQTTLPEDVNNFRKNIKSGYIRAISTTTNLMELQASASSNYQFYDKMTSANPQLALVFPIFTDGAVMLHAEAVI
jgi:hypothetical protein